MGNFNLIGMTEIGALFSFPPQQAGEPSTRNWYQELLDDPGCQNDPAKIQEAYEHCRSTSLRSAIAACLAAADEGGFITPDAALIRFLQLQKPSESHGVSHIEIPEFSEKDMNCLVIWARPDPRTLTLLSEIQNRLANLVGPDLHLIPSTDMHLSVIELSHRHSVSHLRSVYDTVGVPQLERLLDVPRMEQQAHQSPARLVRPMLMFDKVGVAVGFVPAPDHYTHHHLRNRMHRIALGTGVQIDTCYTAPLAHVTIGRFVDKAFFDGSTGEEKKQRMDQWVSLVREINEDLQQRHWGDGASWVVGGEKGLEVQLGYVKFGRGTDRADLVGGTLEKQCDGHSV